MQSPATWRIGEGDTGWSIPIPWAIITCQGPEVSSFGFTGAGIKHWSMGLVHEELGRALQVGDQGIEDGTQLIGCPADPVGKGGAVEGWSGRGLYPGGS